MKLKRGLTSMISVVDLICTDSSLFAGERNNGDATKCLDGARNPLWLCGYGREPVEMRRGEAETGFFLNFLFLLDFTFNKDKNVILVAISSFKIKEKK